MGTTRVGMTARPRRQVGIAASAAILATLGHAAPAHAAQNDLGLVFRYFFNAPTGPITGDQGSFSLHGLPTFTITTHALTGSTANASWSVMEGVSSSQSPGSPYLGSHGLTFDFHTAMTNAGIATILGTSAPDSFTMHLTRNMFPEFYFTSDRSWTDGEDRTFTRFGIDISSTDPGGTHGRYVCSGGDQPLNCLGFDSVDIFGKQTTGLVSLAPIDGDYVFSFERLLLQSTAVPEPATWALMLLGFTGIGAILRREAKRRPGLA